MMIEQRGDEYHVRVSPDHPSFAGHFAGHPILPGVVMLDWLTQAIELELGRRLDSLQLEVVKFLKPVTPGCKLQIKLTRTTASTFKFSLISNAITHATGTVSV